MDEINRIIERLARQRAAIDRAIGALREIARDTSPGPVRSAPVPKKACKRRLSPEGRARIAEAARKRWAEQRAGAVGAKKIAKRTSKKAASA